MNRDSYRLRFAFDEPFSDCVREIAGVPITALKSAKRINGIRRGLYARTTTRPPKEKAKRLSHTLRLAAGLLLSPFIFLTLFVNITSAAEPVLNISSVCNGFSRHAAVPTPVNPTPREFIPADSPWNNYIVRVTNFHPNGFSGCNDLGSGVIIQNSAGQKFVLTAAHIFRDGTGNVSIRGSSGFQSRAEPVLLDRLWDVALLKIDPTHIPGIPFAVTVPAPGDETLIAGFGSDNRLAATHGHLIGYAQCTRTGSSETLKMRGAVRQGDSGGPVLNRRGELIGVVWGTDGQNSYATYSGRIQRLLSENPALRFEPALPRPPQPLPPDSNMYNELNHSPNRILSEMIPQKPPTPADDTAHALENIPELAPKPTAPEDASPNAEPSTTPNTPAQNLAERHFTPECTADPTEIILGWTLKTLLPTLGVTVPSTLLTAFACWKIAHRLRKRFRRRKKNRADRQPPDTQSATCSRIKKVAQTIVNSHNDYALELNDLYNLNGRNSVADATLGRLYDSELAQRESSSNPQMAQFASDLRRKIKNELCRIHSESPVPVCERET